MSKFMHPLAAALIMIAMATPLASASDDSPDSDFCLQCHGTSTAPEVRKETSHAYAVDYDSAQRRRRVLRPSTEPSGLGGTIRSDLLVKGKVECVSCHVRHEEWTAAKYRLRTDTVTALCIICHDLRNARLMRRATAAPSKG